MNNATKTIAPLNPTERRARLKLAWSENVGAITFKHLLAKYGSAVKALETLPSLAQRGGKRSIKIISDDAVSTRMDAMEAFGGEFLIYGEADYPALLSEIEDSPPILHLLGRKELLQQKSLAMVGARNARAIGKQLANQFAHELGKMGYIIASGLARGIDVAAHRGALETGTMAVLGTGLDIIYPNENKDIQEAIGNNGLLITEHPLGTTPQAQHFPRRNRIISGLSMGVLIVEAALKSGSLITARLAAEQNREVFAIPGSPMDPRAKGGNNLIRNGAHLVETSNDIHETFETLKTHAIVEDIQAMYQPQFGFDEGEETFDSDEIIPKTSLNGDHLLNLLNFIPVDVDHLIRDLNAPSEAVLMLLLELELAGKIERHYGNKVSLCQ